jgi:hypothetical protein
MRFLLLCCFNEKQWNAIPEPQRDAIMRDYGARARVLRERR